MRKAVAVAALAAYATGVVVCWDSVKGLLVTFAGVFGL